MHFNEISLETIRQTFLPWQEYYQKITETLQQGKRLPKTPEEYRESFSELNKTIYRNNLTIDYFQYIDLGIAIGTAQTIKEKQNLVQSCSLESLLGALIYIERGIRGSYNQNYYGDRVTEGTIPVLILAICQRVQ